MIIYFTLFIFFPSTVAALLHAFRAAFGSFDATQAMRLKCAPNKKYFPKTDQKQI